MLKSTRRTITNARRNAQNAQRITQFPLQNQSNCLCSRQFTFKSIVILVVLFLCLLSLYLSSIILPSDVTTNPLKSTIAQIPSNPIINIKDNEPNTNDEFRQLIDRTEIIIEQKKRTEREETIHSIKSQPTNDILQATSKSLSMYILREGHNDRVEYLIGFKGNRFTNELQYQNLQPRTQKNYNRNYYENPIKINGWESPPPTENPCDVPCKSCIGGVSCDVGGIRWSMENVEVAEQTNLITGSTKLNSLVPVPYFSWYDFGFMREMKSLEDKNRLRSEGGVALSTAFISNCGFPKRNHMVRDLQKFGVSIDSYGRCEHNKDEDRSKGGRDHSKISIMANHKFSCSFENSETDDYLSEKMLGTLVSGTVPVYIGAPNVHFFAPDVGVRSGPGRPWKSHSIIWAGDYDFNAEELAKHLLYLDGNDTAYMEYVQWKTNGYSGDFKAMVELTSTHTTCRQCVLAGDWSRYKNGVTEYDEPIKIFDYSSTSESDGDQKWIYVRERGQYRFILIRLKENTLESMVLNILQSLTRQEFNLWKDNDHPNYSRIGPALYAIYHVPSKNVIQSDFAVKHIPNYCELEVIFV